MFFSPFSGFGGRRFVRDCISFCTVSKSSRPIEAIETLTKIVFLALAKLVDAIALAWEDMLVCQYCADQCNCRHTFLQSYEREANIRLPQIDETEKQIKEKEAEAKTVQKKLSAPFRLPRNKADLEERLRKLNTEIENFKKRQAELLAVFRANEVHSADELRTKLEKHKPIIEHLAVEWDKAETNLQKTVKAYEKLKLDAKDYDRNEYEKALAAVRPEHEQSARAKIKELFGKLNDSDFEHAKEDVAKALGEWQEPKSVVEELGLENTHLVGIVNDDAKGKRKIFSYVYFKPITDVYQNEMDLLYNALREEFEAVICSDPVKKICSENKIELRLYFYESKTMEGFQVQDPKLKKITEKKPQ